MTIEIRQLRYAVITAEKRSFARAARALNVKQSTLSRRIAALERRLGIKLFERNSRGALPTETGRTFISIARRIITDVDNLQTTARAVSYGDEGRFALGYCSSLMAGNLRMTIADFMQRHPDMQFDATESGVELLMSGLNAHIIDAVVMPVQLTANGLSSRPLWSERLVVAMPDGHKLLANEDILWTDLRREIFVFPSDGVGSTVTGIMKGKLAANGYHANVICQNTSLESVLSTVSFGRYITIATEASLGVTWPGLQFREIADQGAPARIDYALYWRDDNENPALKRFFKLISERYPG
jgi:DNA-binding transcriptional LysR family regulator